MTDKVTLYNTVTKQTINITHTGEYYLDSIDWGTAEAVEHTFKFINQVGVTLNNVTLETRQVTITGWIASENEFVMERLKRRINTFINPQQPIEAWRGEYRLVFTSKTSIRYSVIYSENNEVICKFLITGFCPYPLFEDKNVRGALAAYTEPRFVFPLIIPKDTGMVFGIRQPSLIATVNNNGDYPIGYTMEFRATGTVQNPRLIDIGTQQHMWFNKTLVAGERILVNTIEGQREIIGIKDGEESNYFRYRTFDSNWLQLAVGENNIRYDADNGIELLEVIIRFRQAFLEVLD